MALRYPYEILSETTDYLQIQILEYKRPGFTRGGPGKNRAFIDGSGAAKQMTDAIILPIPSNIQDGNSVSYSDDSLDGFTAGVYNAISPSMLNADNLGAGEALTTALTKGVNAVTDTEALKYFSKSLAAQAANIPFGGNLSLGQIVAREEGQIINPNVELLFNGVTLRSFKFSFKMTPRGQTEAGEIRKIINRLKKSMAPKTAGSDKFLKTPNIFQLTYKKGNAIHPYLHLFKETFLTDMSVNYTGEGVYATYNDGSPISYTMDLSFKEIEPIYEVDYTDIKHGVGF
jgi:hypothetical protein